MTDSTFNFSYNFNDLTQLIFSNDTLLGTNSVISPITINPSIDSTVSQNMVTVKYSNTTTGTLSSLTASIDKISITKDITGISTYAIVLQGSILTKSNSNIYIIIPFTTVASTIDTANSIAIDKIVLWANNQIETNISNTILKESIPLNDLIEDNKEYLYYDNPSFQTALTDSPSNFIIYKNSVGSIIPHKILNKFTTMNNITGTSKKNTIVPEYITTFTADEIMIDCQPLEVTTKDGIKMFSADSGKDSKKSTNQQFINLLFAFIFGLVFLVIAYQLWKLWIYTFIKD